MEEDGGRDWSQLPPELLEKIAGTLTEISDHIRFGAVCPSWRSSSRFISPPPQSPWLLLQSPLDGPDELHFINPSENCKRYTVRNPDDRRLKCCGTFGSANGYLILLECIFSTSYSMVNPLVPGSWHTLPLLPISIHIQAYAKLLKSSDGTLVICCNDHDEGGIFTWRPGDPSWETLYNDGEYVVDIAFYKGSVFLVEFTGETVVLNASTLAVTSRVPPPPVENKCESCLYFLVESSSGELLMVVFCHALASLRGIFQLECKDQQTEWLEITSVGDDVLFMDADKVLCFPASMCNGLRGNCIYSTVLTPLSRIEIGENNNVEMLPYNHDNQSGTWMVPCLAS